MDVTLVATKAKADWDRFVQESPGVIAWHSYDYSDVLAKHFKTEFLPLAVYDGPRIVGILPLYKVRTFRGGDALMSVPYFVAGGIVAEAEPVQRALLDRAIGIANERNISRITFKQYKLRLNGSLSTDDSYYNCELTVSPDIQKIWSSISEINRARVEESKRYEAALRLEYPSSDVSTFYRFLLRDQHSAGVPCVSRAWVQALFDTGSYEIALLRHQGEVVAATMAKKFRRTVSFPFSCVRDRSEQTQLFAYNLYWRLITQLASEGITIVHSGRIPKTDAAPPFRLGWGGTRYSYYYQYHGVQAAQTEFSSKRGSKRQLVEKMWKRMPLAVAGILGPAVARQFP